jgi:hypothetical protein
MLLVKVIFLLAAPFFGFMIFEEVLLYVGHSKLYSFAGGLFAFLCIAVAVLIILANGFITGVVRLLETEVRLFPKTQESLTKVQVAYSEMSPENKKKLEDLAEFAVRAAIKSGSERLAAKGHPNAATVLDKASKL